MYIPKHTDTHNSNQINLEPIFASPSTKEMALNTTDRPDIVFFDIETTRPKLPRSTILEFGAIVVCSNTLEVLHRYSKFVRPADPTQIHNLNDRKNGITKEAVASAGTFAEIADNVYELLNGRIWAGHNVRNFDARLIRDAFNEINRSAPEPKGILDSLELLRPGFAGRFVGSDGRMKLENLAKHFKLGEQTRRSLDDVVMNLEVLKFCATVQFLESSLPDIFANNIWVSLYDINLEEDGTSISPISVTLAPFYPGSQKILVLHRNVPLKLFCDRLRVCFDIKGKFVDHGGRPLLNFMVYASERLCCILERCDSLAKMLSVGSGSNSEWQPVVKITADFKKSNIVRLKLPFVEDVDHIPHLDTEIYQKDDSGTRMVMINTFHATELDHLLIRGNHADAYFSLETYDYNQKAGILLVAEKLIVHSSR